MYRVPSFYGPFSVLLYRQLDVIGVNKRVVTRRTETYLYREAVKTVRSKLDGQNITSIHFGSQSEGTTTPGLQSDTDTLRTLDDVNIMYTMDDWKQGARNYLMVRDATTPAQHYMLQKMRSDRPLPVTYTDEPFHEIDSQGRVLLSNLCIHNCIGDICIAFGRHQIRSGPSDTPFDDMDMVYAFRCNSLPTEIMSWFTHDRHGYWPPAEVFEAARHCPCYLVPDGHHASANKDLEWRITPNLIERILMFSTNMVQRKCLIVMKMLKKERLTNVIPASHVRCKITTFHCKTALFFTLEITPPNVWKKHRLVECIVRCLQTIRGFLFQGECPHYIVENVDLFDGKLCRECQVALELEIRRMIQDDMQVLFRLQCDGLGQKLLPIPRGVQNADETDGKLIGLLSKGMFNTQLSLETVIMSRFSGMSTIECREHLTNTILTLKGYYENNTTTRFERKCISLLSSKLLSTLASVNSSIKVQTRQPFSETEWLLYRVSIDTDVASARLKLASMLYCRGELQRAAYVLADVERRLDDSVLHVCASREINNRVNPPPGFCRYALENGDPETLTRKVCHCVQFMRQERFCAPAALWLEMVRDVDDDLTYRDLVDCHWMDSAEVDAKPFLFYLQYLTYGGLCSRLSQLSTLISFMADVVDNLTGMYHTETVLNLIGHCLELEGLSQLAAMVYMKSLNVLPRNNAANWHLRRLARNMQN